MTHFTTSQKLYMSLVKRPIGFLGALVALILLSPVFLATIVLLSFANKGAGVFFTQDRPGKNEKIFKALKFKTMTDERDAEGNRCLSEWPLGIYQHKGLRGLYLGSNDLGKIEDTISTLCYILDISDNPNIVFDASDICYAWQSGAYILYYDKSQKILNCDAMLK